ncbi:methylated-DNA--[protein]-cysteine S-methyltransferase [Bacillus sp. FJAT-50079]|uniref:methylated-DNA--[protein]-cysteine S-methyltransferase n=1 Tax=Bacillus sp. FJAT-50079 TaxID=2833577 RepID=UPI001BCA1A3D|nr:methylated-DNA--[protein]-cysteine S-methyltransferase [Bacillus sp. FJAT-50079]MBS4210398.1 methylated-DNA--[protein]-cysteine S-methyltransferase [Bacillus sp. FJAT-50079]
MKEMIYWSKFEDDNWSLYLAKTENGLCYIGSPGEAYEQLEAWLQKHFPKANIVESKEALQPYVHELREYFEGRRKAITLPIDIKGTAFQHAVWEALKQIPYGQTHSYSDIAERIQKPKAVRAVGSAIGANPVLIAVPCHRVIGKNGSLTGFRAGIEMKEYLLKLEGEENR